MKCNNCGKQFGDGLNCQHCGIDRVVGLGSFVGLHTKCEEDPSLSGSTSSGDIPTASAGRMLCFNCGEIIPDNAEFCPCCGTTQYAVCPKCGFRYLAQYSYCPKCGTNRKNFILATEISLLQNSALEKEEERKRRKEQKKREIEELRRQEEQKKIAAEKEKERLEQIRKDEEERRRLEDLLERQKEIEAKRRHQREVEAAELLQKKEYEWFTEYISQHKEELLEEERKLNKQRKEKAEGIHRSRKIRIIGLSFIIPLAVLLLNDCFEIDGWGWLLFVAFVLQAIILFNAVVKENNMEKRPLEYYTISSYLMRQYEEANGKSASHTRPSSLTVMFNNLVVKKPS